MSPSGDVITRLVNEAPAAEVNDVTMLAPTIRSVGLDVVTGPATLDVPLPVAAATTSTGLIGTMPLYSAMRMSGYGTAASNVTVTEFPFAAAGRIFAE